MTSTRLTIATHRMGGVEDARLELGVRVRKRRGRTATIVANSAYADAIVAPGASRPNTQSSAPVPRVKAEGFRRNWSPSSALDRYRMFP